MTKQNNIRGVEHLGITVPDLKAASEFFVAAFDACFLYDNHTPNDSPMSGPEVEARLGLAPGAAIYAVQMLRLGEGPSIELFEMRAPDQRPAHRPSDFGLQHFCIYVDDLAEAFTKFQAAGGELLTGPNPLTGAEAGEGNAFRYGRTPWGMIVEFLTAPSPMAFEAQSALRRWKPAQSE